MSNEVVQINDAMRETLRNEYTIVFSNWRSFHILEFAVLAFAATFTVTLASVYRYVYLDFVDLKKFGEAALFSIPLFGIVFTTTVDVVEEYIRFWYKDCMIRARQIEIELGVENGHAFRLLAAPGFIKAAIHVRYIRPISIMIGSGWVYLAYLGALLMKGG